MTYADEYNAIYDAIISILEGLSLFDEVEKGPFATIDRFPSAYVHIAPIDIEQAMFRRDEHFITFIILLAVQGKDDQDALEKAITHFSAVYDAFYINRSLNNTADDAQIARIDPYSDIVEQFFNQYVEMTLTVRKVY